MNLTQESPKPLEGSRTLDMTYSVKWEPTNVTFGRRFDVYLDYPFFEHQVKKIAINLHFDSIFVGYLIFSDCSHLALSLALSMNELKFLWFFADTLVFHF